MKRNISVGIYCSIIIIFILICVLSVFELFRGNSLSRQLKELQNDSSQTSQIAALQSELSSEQAANSGLSSQLGALSDKYQSLNSTYESLQSQIAKMSSSGK